MRHYLHILILVAIFMAGCDSKPSDVLSKSELTDVLFDIHKAEATVSVSATYRTATDKQQYYNNVFDKWGITKDVFDRSLEWYSKKPEVLLEIYDTIRVRADELQTSVENYDFHPDERPTYLDSIDDFDLWKWRRQQLLENRGSKVISPDSLHFAYTDSNYFARGNELIFDLEMSTRSLDSATYRTMLVFHYADSVRDTLVHTSLSDTLTRKFHYYKRLPDSVALARLDVILVDEPFWLTEVEVKNVALFRRYHRYDSPVMPRIRMEVRNSRDSIQRTIKSK